MTHMLREKDEQTRDNDKQTRKEMEQDTNRWSEVSCEVGKAHEEQLSGNSFNQQQDDQPDSAVNSSTAIHATILSSDTSKKIATKRGKEQQYRWDQECTTHLRRGLVAAARQGLHRAPRCPDLHAIQVQLNKRRMRSGQSPC